MKIARVDRGLDGELVFDWRLVFRKAHPVVYQIGDKTHNVSACRLEPIDHDNRNSYALSCA